jgi:hypothetical protein
VERWPSGLRRTLGKRVCGKLYRGFESHSLRHLHDFLRQSTISHPHRSGPPSFMSALLHRRRSSDIRLERQGLGPILEAV